jgi:hypothetical protein
MLTLFQPSMPSPSAVATATTNANISTAITINATAAASASTDVGLCFCHYRHHRFRMYHSHHNHRFRHSCCHFLDDCCLTYHYHCSTDAITNAATSATAATHLPPKLPQTFHCC